MGFLYQYDNMPKMNRLLITEFKLIDCYHNQKASNSINCSVFTVKGCVYTVRPALMLQRVYLFQSCLILLDIANKEANTNNWPLKQDKQTRELTMRDGFCDFVIELTAPKTIKLD